MDISILRHKVLDQLDARARREEPGDGEIEDQLFNRWGAWRKPLARWGGDPAILLEQREFREVIAACLAPVDKSSVESPALSSGSAALSDNAKARVERRLRIE